MPAIASGCAVGIYQGPAGERIVITNRADPGAPAAYWYTVLDGQRGSVTVGASPIRCDKHGFRKRTADSWSQPWRRVEIKETPTHFQTLGTDLYGLLIEPDEALLTRPLVIFVDGSEKTTDIGISYQYIFAAPFDLAAFPHASDDFVGAVLDIAGGIDEGFRRKDVE